MESQVTAAHAITRSYSAMTGSPLSFEETLAEEKDAGAKLNALAESTVHEEAASVSGAGSGTR
jgi:hypothetical protein